MVNPQDTGPAADGQEPLQLPTSPKPKVEGNGEFSPWSRPRVKIFFLAVPGYSVVAAWNCLAFSPQSLIVPSINLALANRTSC